MAPRFGGVGYSRHNRPVRSSLPDDKRLAKKQRFLGTGAKGPCRYRTPNSPEV